jgi:hypothetical protein
MIRRCGYSKFSAMLQDGRVVQKLITHVTRLAIPSKEEFATLAPGHRVFRRWRRSDGGTRDVGPARPGDNLCASWSCHLGDRISMGQEMALNSPSMAAGRFRKITVKARPES